MSGTPNERHTSDDIARARTAEAISLSDTGHASVSTSPRGGDRPNPLRAEHGNVQITLSPTSADIGTLAASENTHRTRTNRPQRHV
jgi:hypothetical protein